FYCSCDKTKRRSSFMQPMKREPRSCGSTECSHGSAGLNGEKLLLISNRGAAAWCFEQFNCPAVSRINFGTTPQGQPCFLRRVSANQPTNYAMHFTNPTLFYSTEHSGVTANWQQCGRKPALLAR